jgi:hypothetical protein
MAGKKLVAALGATVAVTVAMSPTAGAVAAKDVIVVNDPDRPVNTTLVGAPQITVANAPFVGVDPKRNTVRLDADEEAPLPVRGVRSRYQDAAAADLGDRLGCADFRRPARPTLLESLIHAGGPGVHLELGVVGDDGRTSALRIDMPVSAAGNARLTDLGIVYAAAGAQARPGDVVSVGICSTETQRSIRGLPTGETL